MKTRIRQTGIQLKKNWILIKRRRKTTLTLLLIPLFFNFCMLCIKWSIDANPDESIIEQKSQPTEYPTYPTCYKDFSSGCKTFAYNQVGNAQVESVIDHILDKADIPRTDVHGVDTEDDLNSWIFNNPNTTLFGIVFSFNTTDYPDTIPEDARFYIQINESDMFNGIPLDDFYDIMVPYQALIQEKLFEVYTGEAMEITLSFSKLPHPQLRTTDPVGTLGQTFYFWALLFNMIIMAGQIVQEKETKKRFGMKMIGLTDFSYWASWFITDFILITVVTFIIIASGAAFQFDFFLVNGFATYFMLFWLFGWNVVSAAFLITTLAKKTKTATYIGFALLCLFNIVNGVASAIIYNEEINRGWRIGFSFLSPVVFTKGLNDLSTASGYEGSEGLQWSDRKDNADVFSLETCYLWILMDFAIYLLLAFYLDNVLPGGTGVKQHPLFFLKPSYWKGVSSQGEEEILETLKQKQGVIDKIAKKNMKEQKKQDKKNHKGKVKNLNSVSHINISQYNEDPDVADERNKLLNKEEDDQTVLKIYGLTKIFRKNIFKSTIKDFKAVDNFYLTTQEEQLLSLLGPNGSGKTTTINMLTGLFPPTQGFATINGHSILSEIAKVRECLGVCPQHDILWDELTAREHIRMFSGLKNIPKEDISQEVENRLNEVDLLDVGNQRVGGFSGGMKRRLSVAIALTGNSKVVLLDEPTTGMDPVSRRHVWNIIEKAKKNRVILLTTHSMEEADILSDKIAIIAAGKLRCVGTSLHLKNKFGTGYRISMIVHEGQIDNIKKVVEEQLPNCFFIGESLVTLTIEVPREDTQQLPDFFGYLEQNKKDLGIQDFSVSLTTLEEVFLNIAKIAAQERLRNMKKQLRGDFIGQQEIAKKEKELMKYDSKYDLNENKEQKSTSKKKKSSQKPKKKPISSSSDSDSSSSSNSSSSD
ncbi:abc transporter a family member 1-related [Anaeramoeba flamelloides]|uniref:Abc transporter a family member 1-related n=1 Tax=Anaeramoeba flamelloides TaxID=1746091 RepID=A0AAV8A1X7_9EUKA|nr:abc transporter a family member 1-related [Anaeramoeba flamelloides]